MAKAKAKTKNIADQEVTFITGSETALKTGVNLQSLDTRSAFIKKLGEVKEDYDKILQQVNFILTDSNDQVKKTGFTLEEVKVSLGFNAKGKIAFIAEAGVDASIEISFKRK